MRKSRYNWPAIEVEYVTGTASLRDLAAKHGPSLSTIGTRASDGEWESKREHHRNALATAQADSKTRSKLLDKAQFDQLLEQSVDVGLALVNRCLVAMYNSEKPVGIFDVNFALKAAREAQETKYRALGVPMPKQIIEHSGEVGFTDADLERARRAVAGSGVVRQDAKPGASA